MEMLMPMRFSSLKSNNYIAMGFRLVVVLCIGWLLYRNAWQNQVAGQRPIRLSEVKTFLPEAHRLRLSSGANQGLTVYDSQRKLIGYATRTMPHSKSIKGYSGPSDLLIVYDHQEKLRGIGFRHSYDTTSHVDDVAKDYLFMEQWNGKSRDEIGRQDANELARFHIVSGASRTSEAAVRSVVLRAGLGSDAQFTGIQGVRFRWQDFGLILCALVGIALTFIKKPIFQRAKIWWHLAIVIYLGIICSDLIAQSLLVSWAEHGVPWQNLIGLVILVASAFAIPWATGKPIYCTHICPHGHAQRWLMKLLPARKKRHLPGPEKWSFSLLPGLLLITILVISFLDLPVDLAGFEPFDAWSIKGIGIATAAIAIISLIVSIWVPMGYCRYGCPTGFLLDLVKKHPRGGFCRRDAWLLVLLVISVGLFLVG